MARVASEPGPAQLDPSHHTARDSKRRLELLRIRRGLVLSGLQDPPLVDERGESSSPHPPQPPDDSPSVSVLAMRVEACLRVLSPVIRNLRRSSSDMRAVWWL